MKRLLPVLVAALVFAGITVPAQADTIKLYDWQGGLFDRNASGPDGMGGPFRATTTGPLLGDSSFVTFCLEYNEHVSFNTTYTFTLADGARNGGVSGGTNGYDPLSDATKWLYYQAVTGNYADWWDDLGLASNGYVGAKIQYAIWSLEGEMILTPGSAGDTIAVYAQQHAGDWTDLYKEGHRVYALNLTTIGCERDGFLSCDTAVQDVLAYTPAPVPDPGSTMLLLGTGLVGLAGAARKWMRR